MSTGLQSWQGSSAVSVMEASGASWYAVHTRARHEKVVTARLRENGLETFLPLTRQRHRWSDRRKWVEVPLFSCYVFVRPASTDEERLRVLRTEGVFGILGTRGEGTPVPDQQIEAVRVLVGQQLPWRAHPFLKVGQRVKIRGGAMDGIEGILMRQNGDSTLVVSVDVIQRSLAVRIEGYDVEPL